MPWSHAGRGGPGLEGDGLRVFGKLLKKFPAAAAAEGLAQAWATWAVREVGKYGRGVGEVGNE